MKWAAELCANVSIQTSRRLRNARTDALFKLSHYQVPTRSQKLTILRLVFAFSVWTSWNAATGFVNFGRFICERNSLNICASIGIRLVRLAFCECSHILVSISRVAPNQRKSRSPSPFIIVSITNPTGWRDGSRSHINSPADKTRAAMWNWLCESLISQYDEKQRNVIEASKYLTWLLLSFY